MKEAQIIEFFWLLESLVLFGYAILSKFRWKEGIHQNRKTRMSSYKSQNLPRNQFVIEEAEEHQQCKSEEDVAPQPLPQQSIAQTLVPRINYYLNTHLVLGCVALLNVVNGGDSVFLVVMVFLYFVSNAILIVKCSSGKWLLIPQMFIVGMMINYLVVV